MAFEQILAGQSKDAEKLHDLFVQVTDDLSFSRTFYPNRSVRVYLNGLAQAAFTLIYKNRRIHKNRFLHFWMEELPQLVWEARREFALSFGIFVLSLLIGALSCAMDGYFAEVVLGESYLAMTKANIESGDPMAVYKERGQLSMSVGITINNLVVAFLTFVMGAFFTVGTILLLVRNGIMVGVFQYFFIERGLFWESFLTIWIHGTLEISAIIIAGAAGLTLGKGLVFPGAYRRIQAFQRSARRGIKIMLGIAPIIVLAGFIEGFLTRYTETPDVIRGAFIVTCFFFVVFYFVWYPWSKARRGFDSPIQDLTIPPDSALQMDTSLIRTNGDIFSDTFALAKRHAGHMLGGVLALALGYAVIVFGIMAERPANELFLFPEGPFNMLRELPRFFVHPSLQFLPLASVTWLVMVLWLGFRIMDKAAFPQRRTALLDVWWLLPGAIALYFIIFAYNWLTVLLLLGAGQLAVLWAYVGYREQLSAGKSLVRTLQLAGSNYMRTLGLSLLMCLVSLLFFSITDSALLWLFLELINWVVALPEEFMARFSTVVLTVLHLFVLGGLAVLYAIGCALLYHTLLEVREAPALLKKIEQISLGHTIRGLAKE